MQCESGPRSVIMAEEENTAEGQKHVIREAWRLFIRPFVFLLQDPNGPAPLAAALLVFAWHGVAVVISVCNIS